MSNRHHARRRRTYGRRQHEIHERHGFGPGASPPELFDVEPVTEPTAGFAAGALRDLLAPRPRWAQGRG